MAASNSKLRLPGTRVQHGALCCQQDTSHRKHKFPADASIQTMPLFSRACTPYTSRSTTVTTRGDGIPKVPVPYAALQVRAAYRCQKLQPWKDCRSHRGISTWLARNKGGASDVNVRRGGTGLLTPGLTDVRDGQLFSWGNKPRGRKGQPPRNPVPGRQPPRPRAFSA